MYSKNTKENPISSPPALLNQLPNDVAPGKWTTDLFDCFEDPSNCFLTCLCPCITFGRIAEIVDQGTTPGERAGLIACALGHVGCSWLYAYPYRYKLRELNSLPKSQCSDCLLHFFCCECALCQEHRELKNRGIDPSIGWQANVEKWNRSGSTKPPIVEQGMAR